MPYEYVISGVQSLAKLRAKELHEYERPIAILAVQQAEMNRDKKKRKKPFELDDFCLYNYEENRDSIDPIYGAAALALIQANLFPVWALFVYKELSERASESTPPDLLCYQSEEAIILAPRVSDGVCKGMLVAREAASLRIMLMKSPCGQEIRLRMPEINTKIIAEENCYLDVVN